jgi:LPS-assembly lipoprotein
MSGAAAGEAMTGFAMSESSKRQRSAFPVRAGMLAALLLFAGCGFHLRGESTLPFETLFISIGTVSPVGADLKRSITVGSKTRVVESAAEAQAVLQVIGDQRDKVILSLTGAGRVNQFLLRYRFVFKVHDGKGRDIIPENEIVLTREMTYSDAQVLAKEVEEQQLFRDMQRDMVQQVLRRLAVAKAQAAS